MSLMDQSWDQAPKEQGRDHNQDEAVVYLKSVPGGTQENLRFALDEVKDKKDKEDIPKEAGEKLEISDVPSEEVVNPASEVNDESNKEVDEEVREIPEVPSEEVPKKVIMVNEDLGEPNKQEEESAKEVNKEACEIQCASSEEGEPAKISL
ncbi:hypothetical protein Tco_0938420 [Tanacetum coccineum]|uniref:Uncharacterized protein n=1 Tax=Tanacetum coccineum TaxID=301880 RepID=A0ABQ5DH40_9ASTR